MIGLEPDELVKRGASESHSLEFKREMYGSSDRDKREFLKDVSAFANSSGGTIVIGIEEADGMATAARGVDAPNADAESERLTQILRANLDPPIKSVRISQIATNDGRKFFYVHVPESELAPHRTTFKGWTKFFRRVERISTEISTTELKDLFLGNQYVVNTIRDFVKDRRNKAVNGTFPVPVESAPHILIHLCPQRNFGSPLLLESLPDGDIRRSGYSPMLESTNQSGRHNFEGQIIWTGHRDVAAYTQLFRNGCIEAFASKISWTDEDGVSWAIGQHLAKYIYFRAADFIYRTNKTLGPDDFFVSTLIRGLDGLPLHRRTRYEVPLDSEGMPHQELALPELVVPATDDANDILQSLASNCHVLWQSWGFARCDYLDDRDLPKESFAPDFATGVWTRNGR